MLVAGRAAGLAASRVAGLGARLVAVLAVLGLLHAGVVPVAAEEPAPKAPRLALLDRTGRVVTLEALRGRVVLVDFWATWCVPCRQSLPAYDQLLRRYQKQGFEVLAVNVGETPAQVDAYFRGRELGLRIVMDPTGRTSTSFGVHALPFSALVDKDGYIRFDHAGYNPENLPEFRKIIEMLLAEPPEE